MYGETKCALTRQDQTKITNLSWKKTIVINFVLHLGGTLLANFTWY